MNFKYINKTQDVPLKIVLVFLILLIIIGLILIFVYDKQYKSCKNDESPLCITGNCLQKSDTCRSSPFKIIDGKTICKNSLLNQQATPLISFTNSL